MNFLTRIRKQQQKAQRLSEAQRLMAKAYRGVPYTDIHHDDQVCKGPQSCVYRGIAYGV